MLQRPNILKCCLADSDRLVCWFREQQGTSVLKREGRYERDMNSLELQAIGVQAAVNGGIIVTTKKGGNQNRPGPNANTTTYNPTTSNRK